MILQSYLCRNQCSFFRQRIIRPGAIGLRPPRTISHHPPILVIDAHHHLPIDLCCPPLPPLDDDPPNTKLLDLVSPRVFPIVGDSACTRRRHLTPSFADSGRLVRNHRLPKFPPDEPGNVRRPRRTVGAPSVIRHTPAVPLGCDRRPRAGAPSPRFPPARTVAVLDPPRTGSVRAVVTVHLPLG